MEVARGVDSAGGERPREASGEDELGTGRGLEGDEVFLWPDIEADNRALPGHVLSNLARSEKGFHLVTYGQSERHARIFDCAYLQAPGSRGHHSVSMCVTRPGDEVGRWQLIYY